MKKLATVLFALLLVGGIVAPVTSYVHHSLSNKVAEAPNPPGPPKAMSGNSSPNDLVAEAPDPPGPPKAAA